MYNIYMLKKHDGEFLVSFSRKWDEKSNFISFDPMYGSRNALVFKDRNVLLSIIAENYFMGDGNDLEIVLLEVK